MLDQVLNSTVCLTFHVYKGPKMKLGSRCTDRKIQFSGPSLKSLATGFGANSNQGQVVTSIGDYLGLLVTNLNDIVMNSSIPN